MFRLDLKKRIKLAPLEPDSASCLPFRRALSVSTKLSLWIKQDIKVWGVIADIPHWIRKRRNYGVHQKNKAKSDVMADRIIGCPHEEGVDYPDGSKCPKCPFCAIRD